MGFCSSVMIASLLKRAHELNDRLAARPKYMDVRIDGWGGVRNIPVKQIRSFVKDVKAIQGVNGFSVRGPTVQILEKALPQLKKVVEKHGLRMGTPKKWTHPISGFDY